jgi:hypothetical protein
VPEHETFPKPPVPYKRRSAPRRAAKENDMRREATSINRRGAGPAAGAAAALLTAAVLIGGCGGGGPSGGGGVASIRSHSSSTHTATSSAGGGAGPGSSASSQALAYTACVREHGVPDFPEPQVSEHGSSTSIKMAVPASVGQNPKFKSAQQACRKLLPGGEAGRAAPLTSAQQEQYLKAAACIRSHGVPNFPDPTFSGGGVHIDHRNLDEGSPAFKAAVHDCESLIPGGVRG